MAPWNLQQLDFLENDGKFFVQNKITKVKCDLVFFHYHGLREYLKSSQKLAWDLNGYELSDYVVEKLYKPYVLKLVELKHELPAQDLKDWSDPRKQFSSIHVFSETLKRSAKMFVKGLLLPRTLKQVKKEFEQSLQRLNILEL